MIGGLQGGKVRLVGDFEFTIAQTWALEAASQPNITETTSLAAPTPWTYVRGRDVNTVQIFHYSTSLSYARQSVVGQVKADATTGLVDVTDKNPVTNEKDFQIAATLNQAAVDVEYTFLLGVYALATSAAVAARSRGIVTAATTNRINASSVALSKDLMNTLLRTMAANGAVFKNPVIFCGGYQRQRLSEIYGYAPQDRNVGGVAIKQIETEFAQLGVVWCPLITSTVLLVADLAYCQPVFLPLDTRGVLFYEPLGKLGAADGGHIYGQIGLDYGPEEFHGQIYGLTSS